MTKIKSSNLEANISITNVVSDTIVSNTSITAPIFYDKDNPVYYVQPSATSNFNVIDTVSLSASSSGSFNGGRAVLRDNSLEEHATNGNANIAINYAGYAGAYAQPRDFTVYDGQSNLRFGVYGSANYTYSSGSFRSPIFYDFNNSNYYVQPSSLSNFYNITASQGVQTIYNANGNSYNEGIRIPRANNGYTSLALAADTTGSGSIAGQFNLIVNPTATKGGEFVISANSLDSLGIDTSGNLYSYISTRAPIFYDSNNTNYYLDPASTSNLNTVYTSALIGFNYGGLGSSLLSTNGQAVLTAPQQFGRTYESHDFNSYPNLYSSIYINVGASTNVPSGLTGNAYRFIMGAGDVAQRGFDLVGSSTGTLFYRARESGAWFLALADFGKSISLNGYFKLSNGLIIQWGQVQITAGGGTPQTFTFPITFPNGIMNITGSSYSLNSVGGAYFSGGTTGAISTFIAWANNNTTVITYIALGY